MPGGDRTGPMGLGPMTGRAAGYCAGYDMPGYMNPVFGRGGGWFGRGGGRGWRHWYYATGLPGWARAQYAYPPFTPFPGFVPAPDPQEEVEYLREQSTILKQQLEDINRRIEEIQKKAQAENE